MSTPLAIPFVKAHGARNDFLLTWREDLAQIPGLDQSNPDVIEKLSIAICHRNTGVGADGWMLMSKPKPSETGDSAPYHAAIELWNSDGSRSEISGNGTRCAAALAVEQGLVEERQVRIQTGAGLKYLTLLERRDLEFLFEMNMGRARVENLHANVQGHDATILNVGNPQCACFVKNFEFAWQSQGAIIERLPRFPNRTNVSFVRVIDPNTLDVRFFERGAGETMSSGTGSTGAGAAALARGLVQSPVEVRTPAGPLKLRWEGDDILLSGPAEIVVKGEFYLRL